MLEHKRWDGHLTEEQESPVAVERIGTDRLKQLQKNWVIILALDKSVVVKERLKDKVGIEEDFLFNFLKGDQESLKDEKEDSLWKKVDFKQHW